MVWAFRDSPTIADEPVALVIDGGKMASGSALDGQLDEKRLIVGGFNTVLDSQKLFNCVTRTTALRTVFFAEARPSDLKRKTGRFTLVHW